MREKLIVNLSDFEKWLLEKHLAEFKSELYVKEFVSQGFVFLILSGSRYLRLYIIENAMPELKRLNPYLAWSLFSSCVISLRSSHECLEIEYDRSKLKSVQKSIKVGSYSLNLK